MKRKNLILLGLILLLIAANVVVFRIGFRSSSVSFDPALFTVSDTSLITEVTFSGKDGDIILNRSGGSWMVNGTYPVDEGLRRLLFSILNRIEVKREAEANATGTPTRVKISGDQPMEFEVFGNPTRTKTYFSSQGQTYEVELPGYRDYLGSIFELSKSQWRNRMLFDGNWRSIQRLTLDYTDSRKDLEIRFQDQFFVIEGVSEIDSNKVVNYLNQFDRFQANELIELPKFPDYQTLAQTEPMAVLTIESIHYSTRFSLSFYPMKETDRIGLVSTSTGDWAVVDRKRLANLLVETDFFMYQK